MILLTKQKSLITYISDSTLFRTEDAAIQRKTPPKIFFSYPAPPDGLRIKERNGRHIPTTHMHNTKIQPKRITRNEKFIYLCEHDTPE